MNELLVPDTGCRGCNALAILDAEGRCRDCRDAGPTATVDMECRTCGCSDDDPCPGGCYWVAPNLCSRCA